MTLGIMTALADGISGCNLHFEVIQSEPAMNKSPWSSYGRLPTEPDGKSSASRPDPTLGAAANVARGREQLSRYLESALKEYADIRVGRTGYQRLIAAAMTPSPRPESIEERLRRVGGD